MPISKFVGTLLALGLIATLLILFVPSEGTLKERARAQYPFIVLVTLDTLHVLETGVYNPKNQSTPNLVDFAREGVVFQQAYTPVAITLPSHTDLMTGMSPLKHGDMPVIVGVAHFPGLQETVCAAKGEGCRWNGRIARVSRVSCLEEALVAHTEVATLEDARTRAFWDRIKAASRLQRGWSDCYGHCLVATGRAEVMLDPLMKPWDCAALVPILEEAGGTFTDWDGKRTIYGGDAISTNGLLFDQVKKMLEQTSVSSV